ncbi:hypothetical protein NKJ84_32090 [Mesorhizobium sp. M0048]|uniref:hypothetical protein n=1 Tax=Mesorhizobium sp. M0048 TaxID=2956860 RepID=UPI003334AAB9
MVKGAFPTFIVPLDQHALPMQAKKNIAGRRGIGISGGGDCLGIGMDGVPEFQTASSFLRVSCCQATSIVSDDAHAWRLASIFLIGR